VNFKHRFNVKDQGGFTMPHKEGYLLVDRLKKADIEYPFEHGEVINYTLNGVSLHPVTAKIQASFLTYSCQRGRNPLRDFTMRPILIFKKFNG
jgi:hypothetical protein